MSIPTATPISLNGGIYLQSSEYDYSFHKDAASLKAMRNKLGIKPTHLGVVAPFITTGFLGGMGSIYDFTGMNPKVREIEGTVYTWDVPETGADDFYLVEDLSCTDTPGKDEQTFRLRFNSRKFGNTAILTYSKFAKFDLYVTDDEIVRDGGTWVYTVTIKGQDSKNGWFPKEYLKTGTRFTQKSSVHGDTSTIYNTGDLGSTKMSTYFNYVGQTKSNFSFTVGGGASGMKVPNEEVMAMKDYTKVIEMFVFKPGSEAFEMQLKGVNPLKTVYKGDMKAAQGDLLCSTWLPAAEAAAFARLELDCQNEAIWGTGGTVTIGNEVKHFPIGLYHQLNRGNQHYYSIETMTIHMFNGILSTYYTHRQMTGQDNGIVIITGDGGFSLMKGLLQHLPGQQNMMTNSKDYLTGDPRDLKFTTPVITKYESDYGTISFKKNEALNPKFDNEVENPYVGNFRLSSYMFIVMDALEGGSNVELLRSNDGWDTTWFHENGKGNYMGNPNGYQGQMDKPWDFRVAFTKKHYAYRLIDATKSFLIKPINPVTKRPFGEL